MIAHSVYEKNHYNTTKNIQKFILRNRMRARVFTWQDTLRNPPRASYVANGDKHIQEDASLRSQGENKSCSKLTNTTQTT